MYIVYKGEVGVYIDNEMKVCVVVLKATKVIGEAALEKDEVRSASIKCHSKVKAMRLDKMWYT